ncbi:MAG: hypothetical protein ACI8ZB_004405 [Desulforhopalus sp.]|jgi:hypothetical protein
MLIFAETMPASNALLKQHLFTMLKVFLVLYLFHLVSTRKQYICDLLLFAGQVVSSIRLRVIVLNEKYAGDNR